MFIEHPALGPLGPRAAVYSSPRREPRVGRRDWLLAEARSRVRAWPVP
jgi:hypothetical protein